MASLADARERIRRLCLQFPEAAEVEAWGDPTYRVRNKIFAMEKGRGTEVWCKAAPGAQEALTGSEPDRFFVPPYVGSKGWIGVRLEALADQAEWEEIRELIEDSYRLIAPKRLVAALDGARDDAALPPR